MIRCSRQAAATAFAALLILAAFPSGGPAASAAETQKEDGGLRGSGLPLPRFVSLKSGNVNVRRGPGSSYDLAFTFVRAGLPVEITREFDNWRKIRDAEGSEGWVFGSLLSGERTVIVAPWEAKGQFAAHSRAGESAAVVAYLQPRVVADVLQCDGSWCLIAGEGFRGWIEQERLWGVYPAEQFEE